MIWVGSFLFDLAACACYFRRRDDAGLSPLRNLLGWLCLLGTVFLYPTSVFNFGSSMLVRYAVRVALISGFVLLSRPISRLAGFYAAVYWCTMHLITHNFFFSPILYPFLAGSAGLADATWLNELLCLLAVLGIKAVCYRACDRLTPLIGTSPVTPAGFASLLLILSIAIYSKELAVPIARGVQSSATADITSYYLLLQLTLLVLLGLQEYNRRQQRQTHIMQLQQQAAEALFRSLQERREKEQAIRVLRHDLKNHLLSLRLLLEQGRGEEARTHIDSLLAQTAAPSRQYETGNELMDGLLSVKLEQAVGQGISVRVAADFSAAGFISTQDLCIMLGNLLDNALEACDAVPREKAYIHISGGVSGGCLMLQINNACRAAVRMVDHLPVTAKADRQLHGFGLQSVRQVAAHYGGHLTLRSEGNSFTASILIPLPEKA